MDWCVADEFQKANHAPVAILNGNKTKDILRLQAKAGDSISLSSAGSSDPDGQAFTTTWFVYREAGTFPGEAKLSAQSGETTTLVAPQIEKPSTIHVILQLEDSGQPHLFAYRRAVITVQP